MKFSIPSAFTFDGELIDCNFNVKIQASSSSRSAFAIMVSGETPLTSGKRSFMAGSTVYLNARAPISERVDTLIARAEVLIPVVLGARCRILLQDELST